MKNRKRKKLMIEFEIIKIDGQKRICFYLPVKKFKDCKTMQLVYTFKPLEEK